MKEILCHWCGKVFKILTDEKAIICPYCGSDVEEEV